MNLNAIKKGIFSILLLISWGVMGAGIEVKEVTTQLKDGYYQLDAEIEYQPSEATLEALEHGVPITFEVHIEVRREGAWFWEGDLYDRRSQYVLRYHALASMYELFLPDHNRPQRFATRTAALRALGELTDVMLISEGAVDKDESYQIWVSVMLDIESLPVPLRPKAYLTKAWSLFSETRSWPLKP